MFLENYINRLIDDRIVGRVNILEVQRYCLEKGLTREIDGFCVEIYDNGKWVMDIDCDDDYDIITQKSKQLIAYVKGKKSVDSIPKKK